jgi:flagellin
MALNVISNFAANVAHRHLTMSDKEATESVAKLSSGQRVLSAKDDAAALAIGSKLSADVAGLDQASVNAGQAVSMLQIADGGMARIQDILVRMKTVSLQAASGQLSDDQRDQLDLEYQELINEIDRIADDTEFSGTKLLDGSFGGGTDVAFKVGTGDVDTEDDIGIQIESVNANGSGIGAFTNIQTQSQAEAQLGAIDTAIETLADIRAELGADMNRLDFAQEAVATARENVEAARSQLMDLDVAKEMSHFTSKQILVQAGTSMLAQANQLPQNLLSLFR